jgi:hypothetical protein
MQVIYPQLDGVRINENRTLPTAVIQAIRKAYDYIAQISTTTSLGALVIEDTHANRQILHSPLNLALGSFYIETDRNEALYVIQTVGSANAWVLVTGAMRGVVASRPADLTTNDVGFFYVSTDSLDYRWSGSAWTVLDTVKGGTVLTHVGALPKVSATGIVSESAVTDDGTNIVVLNRRLFGDVYGAFSEHIFRRANGTVGAPSAVLVGQAIGYELWRGYGTTAFPSSSSAWVAALAHESFTDTAHGTYLQFAVAADGSAGAAERARLTSAGLSVLTGADPTEAVDVTGNVNASGVYKVGGTQVVSTRGAALTATGAALAGAPVAYSQAYTTLTTQLANNLKTRVDELEARLQAHGLIA